MKSAVSTAKAPAAIGPYSQGIKASGSLVFVSGQLPKDPATGEMAQGIENQARQCLTNIKNILETAGLSMDKVVKTVIFMTDLADFQKVNEVYATFFDGTPPARSTVGVAALPVGVPIEIEAIAMD
jgi:2-iminobutanoate/2-iminopropanoate deaminase